MFSLASASQSRDGEKGVNAMREIVAEDAEGEAKAEDIDIEVQGEQKKGSDYFLFPVTKQTLFFQVILMIVCCHYSMILTNWGNPIINNDRSNFFASNWASFWIKIVLQWLSFLVYFISQALFLCCRHRFEE